MRIAIFLALLLHLLSAQGIQLTILPDANYNST
jgi:hypothetical protein